MYEKYTFFLNALKHNNFHTHRPSVFTHPFWGSNFAKPRFGSLVLEAFVHEDRKTDREQWSQRPLVAQVDGTVDAVEKHGKTWPAGSMLLLCLDSETKTVIECIYLFIYFLFFFNYIYIYIHIYIYIIYLYTHIVEYTERNMFLDDFGSSCSALQFFLPGKLPGLPGSRDPRHQKITTWKVPKVTLVNDHIAGFQK